jgi:hypothetical protein
MHIAHTYTNTKTIQYASLLNHLINPVLNWKSNNHYVKIFIEFYEI